MATLQEVKQQIENANALGVANLTEKGIDISESATTYDIMSKIAEVSGGVVDEKILDHTVTFTVDGEPYEIVSVKNGNSANAPSGIPISENGKFDKWSLNGEDVTFPYTPNKDVIMTAQFYKSYEKMLYNHFGVDKNECPYIVVRYREGACTIYFCTHIYSDECTPKYQVPYSSIDTTNIFGDLNDYDTIFGGICSLFSPDLLEPYTTNRKFFSHSYYYLNNPDIVPDESAGTYYFE